MVQHSDSSIVEVGLGGELGISKEVDEGSLLDKFVLVIDSSEFELLFSVLEVLILSHLYGVSPLVGKLSVFISRVGAVEGREFGTTGNPGEMLHLSVSNEIGNQILMMPDHCSHPVIMFPTTHSGDGSDRSKIKSSEDETSSRSRKGFEVRGNLFGTNSLE